jgi:hypothetical protein
MMKASFIVGLLIATVVCKGQFKPYGGVGVGVATTKIQCPDGNCDQTALGYKVFGGLKFQNLFSVELTYFDFGKSTGNGALLNGVVYNASVHTRAIGATVGRQFFVIPRFSLEPRLGLSSSFASLKYSNYTDQNFEKTKLVYLAGLAVNYMINANWDARLAGDFTQTKVDVKAGSAVMISAGVVFKWF